MRKLITLLAVSATIRLGLLPAPAMERTASMIDTIGVEAQRYDRADAYGVRVLGEVALGDSPGDWSILVGGSLGRLNIDPPHALDGHSSRTPWDAGVGIKYYAGDLTSFSLLWSYGTYNIGRSDVYAAATMGWKQRFLSAGRTLSPYMTGSVSFQSETLPPGDRSRSGEEFSNLLYTFGAGCDFVSRKDLVFAFEAAYTLCTEIGNAVPIDPEGLRVGFYMKYFWDAWRGR